MTEETKTNENAQSGAATPAATTFRRILGEKLGMTQIYDPKGDVTPVTALRAGPCPITQVRTPEKDGYAAVQLGFGKVKAKNLSKAELGHFKKGGVEPTRWLSEFRVDKGEFAAGQLVTVEGRFKPGDYVDVTGTTKGKGFAGVMKRHNFRGLPASHGASDKERSPGSLAARRSLGRVLPGQRMAGHLGHERHTTQGLEIVHVDPTENLIYVRGAVPGPNGGLVEIAETVKSVKHRIVRAAVVAKKKDPLKAAKQAAKGGGKK